MSFCIWEARMDSKGHILVTGGAGYIGSLLTAQLLRSGNQVTVLDSLLYSGESLLGFLHDPNFHFAKADVTEPGAVRSSLRRDWPKPEIVVHLAAIVGFPACQAVGRQVAWKYNVEATKMVFEQAAGSGAERFVFASTYSNYGLSADGKPVTEESPLNPQSLYAETKIPGQIFKLGTETGNYTKDEIVGLVVKRMPETVVNYKDLTFGGDMRDITVSFEKIRRVLGFQASLTADDGVREVVHALRTGLIRNPHDERYRNAQFIVQ